MPTTPNTPCLYPKKVEEPRKSGNVMLPLADFLFQKAEVVSTNILEGTALTRSNKKVFTKGPNEMGLL